MIEATPSTGNRQIARKLVPAAPFIKRIAHPGGDCPQGNRT
jgi:hypothetical protein